MHTVPQSYLEAFAVHRSRRRKPAVWRFDRVTGEDKLVGVRDAEVVKDIYTLVGDDGTPDNVIEEDILCGVEGAFCRTRSVLRDRTLPAREHWASLARFIAVQLLRTPRMLQLVRDEIAAKEVACTLDTPQIVMVLLIERWIIRVAQMRGIIAYNETDFPLLTCDNPAVTWKKRGKGFQCGVDQRDPDLIISCPLAPDLMFVAYQSQESLNAVLAEDHDFDRPVDRPPRDFKTHVDIGTLPAPEVKRLNQVCVSNAHRYVYASYNDERLRRFLTSSFVGKAAPARRGTGPATS